MRLVREESVTHAMVVPTMLNRILDVVEADGGGLPSMRSLAYGGGPMPRPVVERAMRAARRTRPRERLRPHRDVEHRSRCSAPTTTGAAFASDDPTARERLGSVGRVLPGRRALDPGPEGDPVPDGELGEIWVRGEQVSGEYLGVDRGADDGLVQHP